MCCRTIILLLAALPISAHANDWEKFYKAAPGGSVPIVPASQPPEIISFPSNRDELINSMWRRGYGLIGYSNFNSPNAKTKDAVRLGEKLRAAYVVMATQLTSSRTLNLPMSTPTTSTAYTNGNVTSTGYGGTATGTYSGTTTTYGSQTTFIPIEINRFDKTAVFFGPLAKQGVGLILRIPTQDEVAKYETRHLFIVAAVRDGSPSDIANVLEGDAILTINGHDATAESFHSELAANRPMVLHMSRNGRFREVALPSALSAQP